MYIYIYLHTYYTYIHIYIYVYTCRYVYNTYLLMFQREAKWLDWYSIVLYRIP